METFKFIMDIPRKGYIYTTAFHVHHPSIFERLLHLGRANKASEHQRVPDPDTPDAFQTGRIHSEMDVTGIVSHKSAVYKYNQFSVESC